MLSHGKSPDWDGSGDFQDVSVAAALPFLDDAPMDLIGHSFGATLALRLAVAHPDRVRSLTMIEPVLLRRRPAGRARSGRRSRREGRRIFRRDGGRGFPAGRAALQPDVERRAALRRCQPQIVAQIGQPSAPTGSGAWKTDARRACAAARTPRHGRDRRRSPPRPPCSRSWCPEADRVDPGLPRHLGRAAAQRHQRIGKARAVQMVAG
jgi:pimeloyl-ACP methyl ester carboxylesterase